MEINLEKFTHRVSIVIPVYRGSDVLSGLIEEIANHYFIANGLKLTSNGNLFEIIEVILVHDCGPDDSDQIMRELDKKYEKIRLVWLSRNFGQHPATMAGMASSRGDWIVTMDEDGQQDPKYIGDFLDCAIENNVKVVYASPINSAPHGALRNTASKFAKWISGQLLTSDDIARFNSFRLIMGESGRAVAAYGGSGVYLDAALTWVTGASSTCRVELRGESRPSSYTFKTLLAHFGRLVISTGARPLRVISILGGLISTFGFGLSLYLLWQNLSGGVVPAGWTSSMVATLLIGGLTILAIGIIAEFLGAVLRLSIGKPLYLIVNDPELGPLGNRKNSENINK